MNLKSQKSKGKLSKLALFTAALIWGSSFVVVKNTVDAISVQYLIAFRFTAGCIILSLIFVKKLKLINFDYIWRGAILGGFLYLAYTLQTIGITDTTAGKNAFLTAVYCVIVPFMFWIVFKTRPDIFNITAAFLCIIGIGFVSLTSDLTIGFGDAFTLCSGFFYAAHIVAVAKFSKGKDMVLFTIIQFAFVSLFAWCVAPFTGSFPTELSSSTIFGLLFLALLPTATGMLLQNVGQKHVSPSSASILLSLESVFGALFSILFFGEQPTLKIYIGFVLIFISIIISETKLSFLRKKQ